MSMKLSLSFLAENVFKVVLKIVIKVVLNVDLNFVLDIFLDVKHAASFMLSLMMVNSLVWFAELTYEISTLYDA